ncbi:Hypothetical Protein RradSPS_3074 (plasmid) [Rubrobacter radiotolerans]|uniref:Trypsin n=1 Tax=Rubrobacter radiotolerans TaxID=42256 RepID=A0A023X7E4_RUBRA|nr:hypothetical protein [Rubrobacter radiotolerans]AHY48357.1 Hypothetical Protein RradSPS_3074 [Rubrobacter radiotolerans]MDX5895494.1 hypothetical protein [Rubrobacter radiotolerans]SMC01555.1 conserved hypothetical protein [Rubrobacter radiotolerans DSM 5868]
MTEGQAFVADEGLLRAARPYKAELLGRMFALDAAVEGPLAGRIPAGSNVVGVGYGVKVTAGSGVSEGPCVRVYVRAKVPARELAASETVPGEVNGLPTDVVPVGEVIARSEGPSRSPVPCGVSVGHYRITAGTLGCLVRRRGEDGEERYILSNNHVLADSNAGSRGDPVLQPGPADGGDPEKPIAFLSDYEPIDFSGANTVDAAIAALIDPDSVRPEIISIGRVEQPPLRAALYESVRKRGRTTLHTMGVVVDLAADINVGFDRRTAAFEDQIAVTDVGGPFSSGGDSGSLVVDAVTRRPVGLLFAGGESITFVNPIDPVLDRFGAEIL